MFSGTLGAPSLLLHQESEGGARRSIIPKGAGETGVSWTCFGCADDDENLQRIRLKQANLLGPSGFVSMDDSELLKQAPNQAAGYPNAVGVLEMGGRDVKPQLTMATEVGLRAFYDFYRRELGL